MAGTQRERAGELYSTAQHSIGFFLT